MPWAVALLLMAGCESPSLPGIGSSSPRSVSLQQGELPSGLQPCPGSGQIDAFLREVRSRSADEYEQTAQVWRDMRDRGAQDAYEQAYSDAAPQRCTGLFGVQGAAGRPGSQQGGRLAVSLVAAFKDQESAEGMYRRGLFGLLSPDQMSGRPGVSSGQATGLGSSSLVIAPAGSRLFAAAWRHGVFYSVLSAAGLSADEGRRAAIAMDGRIR